MGVYRVIENRVIPEREWVQLRVRTKDSPSPRQALRAGGAEFTPIGFGLPLTVEIAHLYTGKYPSAISGKAPMLLSSALKNLDDSDSGSEAVNFLIDNVGRRTDLSAPPADTQGTPLVCYAPAVTAVSTTITFHLIFQNFPDHLFQEVGSLFNSASSIPLFLSASPYLIGGGYVLKLAQAAGDALFNGKPDFSPTVTINFDDIGAPTQAGYRILFGNHDDSSADPRTMQFDPARGLIDAATQKPYAGNAPYIVIGIDGMARETLRSFAPLAASADILSRFFNIQEGGTVPLDQVLNAMQAVNDLAYRQKAEKTQAQMAATADPAAKAALQEQLQAYLNNIQDPSLIPRS